MMGKKTIEEYREEVANRPFESNKEHRQRVGKISRYVHLKNRDVPHWIRTREVKRYKEMCIRVEEKVQAHIASLPTDRERWFTEQAVRDEKTMAASSHPYYVERRRRMFLAGIDNPYSTIEHMREMLLEVIDIPAAANDFTDAQVRDQYQSHLIKIQNAIQEEE